MKKGLKIAIGILALAGGSYYIYTNYNKRYLISKILKKSELDNTPENRAKLEDSTVKELKQTLSFF